MLSLFLVQDVQGWLQAIQQLFGYMSGAKSALHSRAMHTQCVTPIKDFIQFINVLENTKR